MKSKQRKMPKTKVPQLGDSAQIQPIASGKKSTTEAPKKESWLWRKLFSVYKNFSINGEWRKSLYYFIFGLVIFIFSGPIEGLLSRMGQKLFASWQPQGLYDVLFGLAFVVVLIFQFIRLKINYQSTISQLIGVIISVALYSKFRFWPDSMVWVRMFWCPGIAYSDLMMTSFALSPFQQLVTCIWLWWSKDSGSKPLDIDFNPITNKDDDRLERTEFVELICNEVLNKDKKAANSIGIVGGWGEGKTSILNLLKSRLDENSEVIVMEFSPWLVPNKTDYAQEFLQSLQVAVTPYSGMAKQSIQAFEEALLDGVEKGTISSIGAWVKDQFLPSWTRKSMHEGLVQAVSKMEKKIVVILDDLDRLTADELREAFRIIRNIGCIEGVQLISAFDQRHLLRLMDGKEYGDPASFLQKIFPICHDVDVVPSHKIQELIFGSIEKQNGIVAAIAPQIRGYIRPKGYIEDRSYIAIPANMTVREAKIFAQELISILTKIEEEVYIHDLILITLIKVKYPMLFYSIRDKLVGEKELRAYRDSKFEQKKEVPDTKDDFCKNHGIDQIGFKWLDRLFLMSGVTIKQDVPDKLRIKNERGFNIYFCADNSAVKISTIREVLRSSRENLMVTFLDANPKTDWIAWQEMLDTALSEDANDDEVLNFFWVSICCNKNVFGRGNESGGINYLKYAERFEGSLIKRLPSFLGVPEPYFENAIGILGQHNQSVLQNYSVETFGSSEDILSILHELLESLAADPDRNDYWVPNAFSKCIERFEAQDFSAPRPIYSKRSVKIFKGYIEQNIEKYLRYFFRFQFQRFGLEVRREPLYPSIYSTDGDQIEFLKLVSRFEKREKCKTNIGRFFKDLDHGRSSVRFESPESIRDFFKGTIYEEQMESEVFNN